MPDASPSDRSLPERALREVPGRRSQAPARLLNTPEIRASRPAAGR